MDTNIRKWGNSAGVIIPQTVLKECNLEIGDTVDIIIQDDGAIILKKASKAEAVIAKRASIDVHNLISRLEHCDDNSLKILNPSDHVILIQALAILTAIGSNNIKAGEKIIRMPSKTSV